MNSISETLRAHLLSVAGEGFPCKRKRGVRLFSAHDAASRCVYIESGHVKVSKELGAGRELIVEIGSPGTVCGGEAGLEAHVISDATVVEFDALRFREFVSQHPYQRDADMKF